MIDENGNEAPFDFHNIKVKCTAQNSLNDGINYAINVNGKNNIIKTTAQYSGGGLTYASLPNVYVYGNSKCQMNVVNLIGIGLYLSVQKENASEEELKEILSSFGIPYKENKCDINFERLSIMLR